jgi:hypothetical protein
MSPIPPSIEVSPTKLREMFNKGRFVERAAAGELTVRVVRSRHPAAPKANVPVCTQSQAITYVDQSGTELAMAHQYLLKNGTLGASGLPDPKRIFQDGVLYVPFWSIPINER